MVVTKAAFTPCCKTLLIRLRYHHPCLDTTLIRWNETSRRLLPTLVSIIYPAVESHPISRLLTACCAISPQPCSTHIIAACGENCDTVNAEVAHYLRLVIGAEANAQYTCTSTTAKRQLLRVGHQERSSLLLMQLLDHSFIPILSAFAKLSQYRLHCSSSAFFDFLSLRKTMSKPTIVCVPGLWEGPQAFDALKTFLQKKDYVVHVASLLSTGNPSSKTPKSPSLNDDVAYIRKMLELLVDGGHMIILVLHSGGGPIGSHAIQGLTVKARERDGLQGRVQRIAFVTATAFPEGPTPETLPFADIIVKDGTCNASPSFLRLTVYQGPKMWCKSPRTLLFNDVAADAEAASYINRLQPQPSAGYNDDITYCGWKEVPSSYLVCEVSHHFPLSAATLTFWELCSTS